MDIQSYTLKTGRTILVFVLACMAMCSCDSVIYDDEGDCSIHYRVKFRYDYNMKFADAFAHEVNMVTLYLLDADDNVVWQRTEKGDALSADDYAMEIDGDIPPGEYSMMAWCGTDDKGSFDVNRSLKGRGLTCRLNRQRTAGGTAFVADDIDRLYYGRLEKQTFGSEEGTYTYTMPLVKNTNNVRIVLQNLSGDPIDKDIFSFTITADNGTMDWDNSLIADEPIIYEAWHKEAASADFGTSADSQTRQAAITAYSAVVAELTVARLVKGCDVRLTVTNNETGETVLSIPLIDYALLVKGYYNRSMSDQEYLDRQDVYDMVFFLDKDGSWMNSYIYINSWKVVFQETEL